MRPVEDSMPGHRREGMGVSETTRIGTVFAGYRVESLLGRGGMSVVYLAEHVRLGRKVALKVLASPLDPRRELPRAVHP